MFHLYFVKRMYIKMFKEGFVLRTLPVTIPSLCINDLQTMFRFTICKKYVLRTFNSKTVTLFFLNQTIFRLFLGFGHIFHYLMEFINFQYLRRHKLPDPFHTTTNTVHQTIYRLHNTPDNKNDDNKSKQRTDDNTSDNTLIQFISCLENRIFRHKRT